ncbi:hypothetical protein [uncultured Xylophilus sp.]|uniref:hypothetical protein n=1 Tax=uncultured Xylophilus sp. TaxID=296832 RepID=UPI0025ECF867|nr:hypothetical protein [uncultured Xylophilus sp.]
MKNRLYAVRVLMAAASLASGGGGFAASSTSTRATTAEPAGEAPAGTVDAEPVVADPASPVLGVVETLAHAPGPSEQLRASMPATGAETALPVVLLHPDADPVVAEAAPAVEPQRPGTTAPSTVARPEAPQATVLPQDEFHGLGGDYVIGADGVRRPDTPAAAA